MRASHFYSRFASANVHPYICSYTAVYLCRLSPKKAAGRSCLSFLRFWVGIASDSPVGATNRLTDTKPVRIQLYTLANTWKTTDWTLDFSILESCVFGDKTWPVWWSWKPHWRHPKRSTSKGYNGNCSILGIVNSYYDCTLHSTYVGSPLKVLNRKGATFVWRQKSENRFKTLAFFGLQTFLSRLFWELTPARWRWVLYFARC
jgi:hypothetical protein